MADQRILAWTEQQIAEFGHRTVVARHRLHEMELFSDAELVSVLENHPREHMQAFTMGTDPSDILQWRSVDIAGVSGKDLLAAIRCGRLWFHLFKMQSFDVRYRELLEQLFSELTDRCQNLIPLNKSATLILSSPTALVYYHADPQLNLLWHVRGSKHVWSYPACDSEIMNQQLMEDIFASYADEEVPYRPEFDSKATVFRLDPGDVISWPLNAPHRVTNLDGLNVSLSTTYETEECYRRKLVYCANRYFRRSFHIPTWSTQEGGAASYLKRSAYRVLSRFGVVEVPRRRAYITNLRIDPDSPDGVRTIGADPVLTEFSKKGFALKKTATGEFAAVPIDRS